MYHLKEGRRPWIRRTHVPSKDNNSDTTRTCQLEGSGHRLGAAAGNPRVIHDQDIGTRDRIADAHPAGVYAPCMDRIRRDCQPHPGQVNARPDHADQRMDTRAALSAWHDRDSGWTGRHLRRRPDRVPVVGQEGREHSSEPGRGCGRLRRAREAIRFISVQVTGELAAAHRVPDWCDGVCEQPGGLAQRQFTLVTPGKASPSRPPAGSADHTPMLGTTTDKAATHSRW